MSSNRGYKRSWKNYLLDSSYQLRFTFTILAVAIGLMAPLGWWVSVKASSATEVALTRIDGIPCEKVLVAGPRATPDTAMAASPHSQEVVDIAIGLPGASPAEVEVQILKSVESHLSKLPGVLSVSFEAKEGMASITVVPSEGAKAAQLVASLEAALGELSLPESAAEPELLVSVQDTEPVNLLEEDAPLPDEAPVAPVNGDIPPQIDIPESDSTDVDVPDSEEPRERAKIAVDIYEDEMPVVVVGDMVEPQVSPEEIAKSVAVRENCLSGINAKREAVLGRQFLITIVMIVSALLLLLCLAFYGILSTHKVAGPLFKTGLYFRKLEDNVYDTVYNLRKGDQLVEFYEHFKAAHAGLTKMQEEDRDRLKEAIALAKETGLSTDNPSIATIVTELERLLAQKEESLARNEK